MEDFRSVWYVTAPDAVAPLQVIPDRGGVGDIVVAIADRQALRIAKEQAYGFRIFAALPFHAIHVIDDNGTLGIPATPNRAAGIPQQEKYIEPPFPGIQEAVQIIGKLAYSSQGGAITTQYANPFPGVALVGMVVRTVYTDRMSPFHQFPGQVGRHLLETSVVIGNTPGTCYANV
jgi:hypothetical protein